MGRLAASKANWPLKNETGLGGRGEPVKWRRLAGAGDWGAGEEAEARGGVVVEVISWLWGAGPKIWARARMVVARVAAAAVGRRLSGRESLLRRMEVAATRPAACDARHHGHHAVPRPPQIMSPTNQRAAPMRVQAAKESKRCRVAGWICLVSAGRERAMMPRWRARAGRVMGTPAIWDHFPPSACEHPPSDPQPARLEMRPENLSHVMTAQMAAAAVLAAIRTVGVGGDAGCMAGAV